MTARKVRLGPGGKVLMVLLGVGLILWGLDAYGYFDPVRQALGWARGPAATAVQRPAGRTPGASTTAARDGTRPATATGPVTGQGPAAGGASAPPPALPGAPAATLRDGGDALWAATGGPAPQAELAAVVQGRLDLVPVALPDLLLFGRASKLVVIGAVPPRPRFLCAEAKDPVQAVLGGASLRFDRISDELRIGLLFAAHGQDPAQAVAGEGTPAFTAAARSTRASDHCVDLARLGVDGPRVVVARAPSVRLQGRAYLAAAKARGALTSGARAWLAAPAANPYGYAHRAAALAGIHATLQSTVAPAVPAVAQDLLTADARGVLGLFGPVTAPKAAAKAAPKAAASGGAP